MANGTVHKGRGATINPQSRYLVATTVPVDDGWDLEEDPVSHPATEFFPDRTVRLIARNQSPDIPFDRSINAYKGCEHGCVYCYARPTHAYLDLSPGLDFETRIFYKTGVRERLVEELGRRSYECRTIAMGTNTDPYQPVEKRLRVTRTVLEVALEHRHPVSIVTKSQLILRDADLLVELARLQLVNVMVSVTTLSNALKVKLEPRTASPAARLRTIERLSGRGVPVGAMAAPMIPFINDEELEAIVARASAAGARAVRLCAPAFAARGQGSVRSLACRTLPVAGREGHERRSGHPRRQGVRLDLGQTHARYRAIRGTAGGAVHTSLPRTRPGRCGIAASTHRPFHGATGQWPATVAI